MTDLRQAAQQALEALETLMIERESIYDKAITAIKESLAREHAMHDLARLGQEIEQGKRGSIALARELCVQIAGYTDDDQDQCGHDYGSVDIAEILSAEVVRLQKALAQPKQQADKFCDANCVWTDHHPDCDLAQPEQEPVAYYHPRNGFYWAKPTSIFAPTVVDVPPIPLYTTAAQREWAGLTDEDWEKVANRKNTVLDTFEQGAAWAAARLKERNK